MLCKKPSERLGAGGADEIKSHPWFSKVKWDQVQQRWLRAPFPYLSKHRDANKEGVRLKGSNDKDAPPAKKNHIQGWSFAQGKIKGFRNF